MAMLVCVDASPKCLLLQVGHCGAARVHGHAFPSLPGLGCVHQLGRVATPWHELVDKLDASGPQRVSMRGSPLPAGTWCQLCQRCDVLCRSGVEQLPEDLSITGLVVLELGHCAQLSHIPEPSLRSLVSLTRLDMNG